MEFNEIWYIGTGIFGISENFEKKKKSSKMSIRERLFQKNIKFNAINDENRIQEQY